MIIRNDGTGTPCFIIITRVSGEHFWYKNMIDRMAHVIDDGTGYLYDILSNGLKRYIRYDDAVLLERE